MMVRVIAAVAAGLVVGSGVTVVVMRSGDAETGTPVAAGASSVASSNPLAPGVPGWATVRSDRGLVFDVPPTWKPPTNDARLAVLDANSNPLAGMRFVASRQPGTCAVEPDHYLSAAGVAFGTGEDPASAAAVGATTWAHVLYTPDKGTQPDVTLTEPVDVQIGAEQGKFVTATVKTTAVMPCGEQAGVVRVVAVPTKTRGMALMVVFGDRNVPGADTDDDLKKIAASFRAVA
jgi:hypothetical protein